ncbi:uncharacterized protein LOC111716505 isoform X2 [Eurytemora carolleeae]|uniref:uncharacterized protein LOC111716505 isoform X2 n=1 Tax=Eurytemora carolleeae TaxID=1294199 RepID=UPI000C787244|nr:uncharacterized protein LOC111716505 isoform X2 [Eurytemora carolleeae]|eukprot:XP_023347751.1 uncharacterized protein LOC111716505 isoform X2 [Eurytemora affinis]
MQIIERRIELEREREEIDKDVAKLLKQLNPGWKKRDIIIHSLNPTLKLGYSDKQTNYKLLVKILRDDDDQKVEEYFSRLNQAYSRGVSPELVGVFKNGSVQRYSYHNPEQGNVIQSIY